MVTQQEPVWFLFTGAEGKVWAHLTIKPLRTVGLSPKICKRRRYVQNASYRCALN